MELYYFYQLLTLLSLMLTVIAKLGITPHGGGPIFFPFFFEERLVREPVRLDETCSFEKSMYLFVITRVYIKTSS